MKKAANASGTFGAPKPLPGQAGYRETETDRLKKDADDMEARLLMLQDRMKSQNIDAGGAQAGSGKWKSGSVEKGSIRAYGKEVQEKVKKKLDATNGGDPALRTTNKRPTKVLEVDFKAKDVGEWSVPDVSAWLTEVQLQQYVSAFAQNAISGSVLVDITAEDLDYMEIKALGHRKILLKGVDDLRKNKFYSAAALSSPQKMPDMLRTSSNPNMGEGSSDRALMSTSMQMSGSKYSPTEQSASVKSTHWSHLEPISANKVSNPRGGGMINPADDEPGGVLDEAAERAAFAEAVAEWRRADATTVAAGGTKKPMVIEREYLTGPSKTTSGAKNSAGTGTEFGEEAGGMGMWKNPFAPAPVPDQKPGYSVGEDLDEAAERKAFQEAVMDWRRGPTNATPAVTAATVKPSATTSSTSSTTTATTTTVSAKAPLRGLSDSFESDHGFQSPSREAGAKTPGAAGALSSGDLDEAREHAEFVKAVDSWREGKGAAAAGSKPASSSQALADKISQELEASKMEMTLKLQQRKVEAERRMQEANLELKKLRSAKNLRDEENNISEHQSFTVDSKNAVYDDELDDDEDQPVGHTYSYSSAPSSHIGKGHRVVPELQVSPRVVSDSVAPTPRVEESAAVQSSVGVALVESVLGSFHTEDKGNIQEEYYVVEVDSDDE